MLVEQIQGQPDIVLELLQLQKMMNNIRTNILLIKQNLIEL